MNPFQLFVLALSGLLGCGAAMAQTGQPEPVLAFLPPAAMVQNALLASPAMQAALQQKSAQMHRAQMTAAGTSEFNLRLSQQNRRMVLSGERLGETSIGIERPLRAWGKSQLDADLAEQSRQVARIAYADALHEASRELMRQWFGLRRTQVDLDSARTSLTLAQALNRLAQARLKQGEVSALDSQLAQAELARAQAAWQWAQAEQEATSLSFDRMYPGVSLAWGATATDAQALPALPPMVDLQNVFLQNHHELNLWRAEVQRLQLLAQRLDKDQRPDPTLGVFALRERQGAEQVVGVSVSWPLGGSARTSHALAAKDETRSAQAKLQQMVLQLGADFEARWTRLQHLKLVAQNLQRAAQIQQLAADKSLKAYSAGEHTMTELLHNRRLANEQHRESARTEWDVVERQALLTLDLHQIWDFDE